MCVFKQKNTVLQASTKRKGKKMRNKGFTLVEILIVVVILGILAAIVIPQFSNASQEASLNRVMSDLQTVRSQIQLYKIQHLGTIPALAQFPDHMTGYTLATTAANGDNSAITVATDGALGPYLQSIPTNPFASDTTANIVASSSAESDDWTYDAATGEFNACQGSLDSGIAVLTAY